MRKEASPLIKINLKNIFIIQKDIKKEAKKYIQILSEWNQAKKYLRNKSINYNWKIIQKNSDF